MSAEPVGRCAWDAAKRLVGTGFRLQGRDPATGLDCIGVVIAAYAAAGVKLAALDDYPLRGTALADALAAIAASGLTRRESAAAAGDVALYALPAGQLHVALLGPASLIHADAGLRRVVEAPLARLPAPLACWHWTMKDGKPWQHWC
jgi:cell wall-associated NlpC family hydrolase